MHPMLVVQAAPGLIYVNGRFCGEVDGAGLPLAPDGTVYVEYLPLASEENTPDPMALRLNLRAGRLEGGMCPQAFAVQWPDGHIALELRATPQSAPPEAVVQAQLETPSGILYAIAQDGLAVGYTAEDSVLLPLPEMAQAQRFRNLSQSALRMCALEGRCGEEAFVALLSSESPTQVYHCMTAYSIEISEDGVIRSVRDEGDLVGHASLEAYAPDAGGKYVRRRQEGAWLHGTPRWPQTPADTARAWLEAIQRDNLEEARGYLLHPEQITRYAQSLGAFADVVALPYPIPGAAQIEWGVLEVAEPQLAYVRAVGFTLVPQQHAQGSWRIAEVTVH